MSVRDLLSNHKASPAFLTAKFVSAVMVTEPVDLSVGGTAMFNLATLQMYTSTSTIDSIIIEYSEDAAFTVPVPDPLDPVTNLSVLGNSIYNADAEEHDFPRLMTATDAIGTDWGLPVDLSSFPLVVAANVVNPLGTYRYCRLKMTATTSADEERVTGYIFVGPVRYKNSDGGIA